MYTQYRPTPARLNTFHGPKRQLLGNQAGHTPPAWRTAQPTMPDIPAPGVAAKGKAVAEQGSKILLSRLPVDVGEEEVEELFRKTVGPLKESFLIYNSQGKSKGMAVVTFQRTGDATAARAKYDGKVVDGRRPIKIEIITDGVASASTVPPPVPTFSLLQRMGGMAGTQESRPNGSTPVAPRAIIPRQPQTRHPAMTAAPMAAQTQMSSVAPPRKVRVKKGPRRVNKRMPVVAKTRAQLDKEMDDYQISRDLSDQF